MLEDLRELYQEVILDHGRSPRNFRHPDHPSHLAHGHNPLCGDVVTVYLTLDGDVIHDAAFEGKGCAISTASASLMTEVLKGRTMEEALRLFDAFHHLCTDGEVDSSTLQSEDVDALERLEALAGVREFPIRVKCATLAWHTMKAAVTGETETTTE